MYTDSTENLHKSLPSNGYSFWWAEILLGGIEKNFVVSKREDGEEKNIYIIFNEYI